MQPCRVSNHPRESEKTAAFTVLRTHLYPKEIKPQKLEIWKDILQTLNDFQKLLGAIQ